MTTTKMDTPGTATGTIPCPKILGIPVIYDADLPILSDSSGIWRWKKIFVGPYFYRLSERQQGAVLLHEAGHCKMLHVEKIILHALLRPRLIWAVIAASIEASRRFELQTREAILWFQTEIERRAPGSSAFRKTLELQADRYATLCGYGPDLVEVFRIMDSKGGPFHPGSDERIRAIQGLDLT